MATHAVTPVDAQVLPFQPLHVSHRKSLVFACVALADLLGISLSSLPLVLPRAIRLHETWRAGFFMYLLTFVAVLALAGLYRRIRVNTVLELKELMLGAAFFYLLYYAMPTLQYHSRLPSPALLLTSYCLSVTSILLFRSWARQWFSSKAWASTPTVVFYTGNETSRLIKYLKQHPECGIRPIAVLLPDDMLGLRLGVPAFSYRHSKMLREEANIQSAIVIHSDHGSQSAMEAIEPFEAVFPHLLILNGLEQLYSLDVCAVEIGHSVAIGVKRKSLSAFATAAKRTMELVLVLAVAPFVALIVGLLALIVRLDSSGPVFFGHTRIGRDGRKFQAWKIRTMKVDASKLLQELLQTDAEARAEWERDRKLRADPRITRIGKWLRRTSLDELPQLWNVLRGDMSLVGPRPIVQEEAGMYGQHFPLYCRVKPGITGLWQVSGRNTTTIPERVRLDAYYVRNWSPWLDVHILLRTARAVLGGRGAY